MFFPEKDAFFLKTYWYFAEKYATFPAVQKK